MFYCIIMVAKYRSLYEGDVITIIIYDYICI